MQSKHIGLLYVFWTQKGRLGTKNKIETKKKKTKEE